MEHSRRYLIRNNENITQYDSVVDRMDKKIMFSPLQFTNVESLGIVGFSLTGHLFM